MRREPSDPEAARTELIERKLKRLRHEQRRPRVVDLFCGAGGFSLGFEAAGCEILAGLELDKHAAKSHALNFHGRLERAAPVLFERHGSSRDICETDPIAWLQSLGYEDPASDVDILIGGPPCPAYTRVGRAKLREIHDHPEAFRHDPRATLYLPYLKWVRLLSPVALVMENVPDILNFAGHNLAEEICAVLDGLGYDCKYSIVNAAAYGVPQTRQRFMLVGVHAAAGREFEFPSATHCVDLPVGYDQAEKAALKPLRQAGLGEAHRFVVAPSAPDEAPLAVTAADALDGLPRINSHLTRRGPKGAMRPDGSNAVEYPDDHHEHSSVWVKQYMLAWPRRPVGTGSRLIGHFTRNLTFRDYRLFASMPPGEQYYGAYRRALTHFDAFRAEIGKRGGGFLELSEVWAPAMEAIAAAVEHAAVLLEGFTEELDAQSLSELLESRCPAIEAADRELSALAEQIDAVGIELEAGAEVLGLPLLKKLRGVQDSLVLTERPFSKAILNKLAQALGSTSSRVLKARSRQSAWPLGLEALGVEKPGAERLCPVAPPAALPDPRATSRELKELASKWSGPKSRPAWPSGAPQRALLELAVWRLLETAHRLMSFHSLKHRFVPPYIPDKFPNKWRKMEADAPARTLMAHLGKDTYSHIHFDSQQARTITVREAARLQSFPDSFRFVGSMNPAFKQIGNAVPPLLAWRLGDALLASLAAPGATVDRQVGGMAESASPRTARPATEVFAPVAPRGL